MGAGGARPSRAAPEPANQWSRPPAEHAAYARPGASAEVDPWPGLRHKEAAPLEWQGPRHGSSVSDAWADEPRPVAPSDDWTGPRRDVAAMDDWSRPQGHSAARTQWSEPPELSPAQEWPRQARHGEPEFTTAWAHSDQPTMVQRRVREAEETAVRRRVREVEHTLVQPRVHEPEQAPGHHEQPRVTGGHTVIHPVTPGERRVSPQPEWEAQAPRPVAVAAGAAPERPRSGRRFWGVVALAGVALSGICLAVGYEMGRKSVSAEVAVNTGARPGGVTSSIATPVPEPSTSDDDWHDPSGAPSTKPSAKATTVPTAKRTSPPTTRPTTASTASPPPAPVVPTSKPAPSRGATPAPSGSPDCGGGVGAGPGTSCSQARALAKVLPATVKDPVKVTSGGQEWQCFVVDGKGVACNTASGLMAFVRR